LKNSGILIYKRLELRESRIPAKFRIPRVPME
jgi:hypothetical protein